MRESFENSVNKYNKEISEEKTNTKKHNRIIESGAKDNFTDTQTQELVYDVQKEKHALMEELHEDLHNIDVGEPITPHEGGVDVAWDTTSGHTTDPRLESRNH